ncbi:MAG TPA: ATP-binding protein [Telluria sp.]|nr:ATP-binding protein [Telluria sp.]
MEQLGDMDFFEADLGPASAPASAAPEQRLQYLLDNTPAIIYCTVPSGDFKMTFVSNNALHVLGYHPEEMVADPNFWFDHIHPDDAPAIFSSLAQLFVDGERTYEYRFRIASGAYLWMHDSLRLIRDANGAPLEVVGALTDITVRKGLEQEQGRLIAELRDAHHRLLQSEKLASIGQLAAGIAHEVNNPLGFVNSNMGTLQTYVTALLGVIDADENAAQGQALAARFKQLRADADLDFLREDVADLLRESRDGLRRVKEIVQSLMDFSHLNEAEWQMVDLNASVDHTLDLVARAATSKPAIEREYGALAPLRCLGAQVNQVFTQVLANAFQAVGEGGTVKVRTWTEDGTACVAISDNGCGIEPQHLNRIFEPFFTTRPVGSGTGLGLSLAYGIVTKHGGQIEVKSAPGRGSTFVIRLPLDAKE